MKIAMIGTGYVGLVTGACLAKIGHEIICVDHDDTKVVALRGGTIPIYEPGLDNVVAEAIGKGQLSFTADLAQAVESVDVVFIAVGTPQASDGRSDLSQIETAAKQIAKSANGDKLVVVKSTVPVGTCRRVGRILGKHGGSHSFRVASNPEFLREGNAVSDFMQPDRIVYGSNTAEAEAVMDEIYAQFEADNVPMVKTTLETSELIKYSANAFLAAKVAFINEMANLCDATGANVEDLSLGIGLDERIGKAFLKPGPGYGGSCFPKDTLALTILAQEADSPSRIIESVVDSNSNHIRRLGRKIADFCADSWGEERANPLIDKRIAVLGLAFKANTDDIRSAASTVIAPLLIKQGASVIGFDPEATQAAEAVIDHIETTTDIDTALTGADAVVVLTEWDVIKAIEWAEKRPLLNAPVVIDLRNLYAPERMAELEYHYLSLGRPNPA
ncbi:MAG: UDP-glucose/GDP-mannose dehydrogenase family protein [Rhizobiaceae bacterium]|nr:UDP-glucose/GDP-mannose dehydrogenase family protein [Hyphomicrobiales bacterium]NRB30458.1 UDP-glucose/GDP-mannose dehydrogenase family protein [Rhizobiaceae bacterium]